MAHDYYKPRGSKDQPIKKHDRYCRGYLAVAQQVQLLGLISEKPRTSRELSQIMGVHRSTIQQELALYWKDEVVSRSKLGKAYLYRLS